MKDFLQSLIGSSIRWLFVSLMSVGTAYFAVEAWVDTKVEAAENRVMFVRGLDMEHLNNRFDTIEKLIKDRK